MADKKLKTINTNGLLRMGTFKCCLPKGIVADKHFDNMMEGSERNGILYANEDGMFNPVLPLSIWFAGDDWFETNIGVVIPEEDVYEIELDK